MGVELSGEADLQRRIDARIAAEGMRKRERCKRCRVRIPETKRSDSIYCSQKCQRAYRWEQYTVLRTEMRDEYRKIVAPTACKCGEPFDNRPGKHAPVKRICRKCSNREAQRRRRKRLLEKEMSK